MAAIGIDIGGTKLAIGVVDGDGHLHEHHQVPLPTRDYNSLITEIGALIRPMRQQYPDVNAVGGAVASWLSPTREKVLQAVNLGWDTKPLRADLQHATGLPHSEPPLQVSPESAGADPASGTPKSSSSSAPGW